jgi:hypothetical protein
MGSVKSFEHDEKEAIEQLDFSKAKKIVCKCGCSNFIRADEIFYFPELQQVVGRQGAICSMCKRPAKLPT